MAGAPSHADDWRCPLHCHSMTVPRLLKIDGGELGQKKHVNSDQKTQLGHVAAHVRTASKSSAWSHGEIVAVWKRGSNLLAAGRDEIPVMQERKKISASFNTNNTEMHLFIWIVFFPRKRQYISWWHRQTLPRSRYWLFKVRWYVFCFFLIMYNPPF